MPTYKLSLHFRKPWNKHNSQTVRNVTLMNIYKLSEVNYILFWYLPIFQNSFFRTLNQFVSIRIECMLNDIGHIVPKKEKRGEWDISKLNQNVKFSWVQSVEDRHYWFCEWHVSVEWGEQKNVNGISIYAEENSWCQCWRCYIAQFLFEIKCI